MARIVRRSEFLGKGCALQALGLFAPVLGGALGGAAGAVLGLVAALVFLIAGGRLSYSFRCDACGNPVVDGHVTLCPTCKLPLTR